MVDVKRDTNANPIESKRWSFPAVTNGTSVVVASQKINGFIKNFSYKAPNLTTDSTFNLKILDENNNDAPIFEATGIADNQAWKFEARTMDQSAFVASDKATIEISWTTAQTLSASDFELILPMGV